MAAMSRLALPLRTVGTAPGRRHTGNDLTIMDQDPDQPIFADDPTLSIVARYWSSRRRGRPMPTRTDIDPLHLPATVWPHLLLAEPVAGSTAIRYRLVGSAHVERYTFDFTGRLTSEIMQGSYRTYMEEIYATTLRLGLPVYSESMFRWDADGYAFTRRVMLPLQHGSAGMIFSAQVWPGRMSHAQPSITALSGTGAFRDGDYVVLDADSFRPRKAQAGTA